MTYLPLNKGPTSTYSTWLPSESWSNLIPEGKVFAAAVGGGGGDKEDGEDEIDTTSSLPRGLRLLNHRIGLLTGHSLFRIRRCDLWRLVVLPPLS